MNRTEPKVSATIDLLADGKHHGHLIIPHSRNESGWGAVHLPIVSIRNGAGTDDASNRRQSWRRIRGADRPDETG